MDLPGVEGAARMSAQIIPIDHKANKLFEEYVEALERVQQTKLLEDGIRAGKAYRRFLDTFLSAEQRQFMGSGK